MDNFNSLLPNGPGMPLQPSNRNFSVKKLNLIFYSPSNRQTQSGQPASLDEVEVMHIQTPHHLYTSGHGCAHSLFSHLRLPKLGTLIIDYDFGNSCDPQPIYMDLHILNGYYLQSPLFEKGLDCLVLNLYKSCRVDPNRRLPIAFHLMPPVRELRLETPHPFQPLNTYMEGKPMPSFRRVVFHECANLTCAWLSEFVGFLRQDDATWNALDEIVLIQCPLVNRTSIMELALGDKVSCWKP